MCNMIYTYVIAYEITKMFDILYPNGGANAILLDLRNDVDFDGILNINDFVKWTQKKPHSLSPLLRLHQQLSETFGSGEFWLKLAEKRTKLAENALRGNKCMVLLRARVRELKARYETQRKMAEDSKVRKIRDHAAKGTLSAARLFTAYMTQKNAPPKMEAEKYPSNPLAIVPESSALAHNYLSPLKPAIYPGVNPYREKQFEIQERRSEKQRKKELIRSIKEQERAASGKLPKIYVTIPLDDHDHNIPVPTSLGTPLRSPSKKKRAKSMKKSNSSTDILNTLEEREMTGDRKMMLGTYQGHVFNKKEYISPFVLLVK